MGTVFVKQGVMDFEAALFVNEKQPKLVVPIHYGETAVVETFQKQLASGVKVQRFW